MDAIFVQTLKAIGPVWPAMLLYLVYMAATSFFLILAQVRAYFKNFTLRELRFMQRMYDATEMTSTLAILTGMIGTCLGLMEVLPVLGDSVNLDTGESFLAKVLAPLENVWLSTIAGLALGGLWGEILIFLLKPYTRPALLPLSRDELPQPEQGLFDEAESLALDSDGHSADSGDYDDENSQIRY